MITFQIRSNVSLDISTKLALWEPTIDHAEAEVLTPLSRYSTPKILPALATERISYENGLSRL